MENNPITTAAQAKALRDFVSKCRRLTRGRCPVCRKPGFKIEPAPDGSYSYEAFCKGRCGADTTDSALRGLWESNKFDFKSAPEPESDIAQSREHGADAFIADFNRRHAFVMLGGKAAILIEPEAATGAPCFTSHKDLRQQQVNKLVTWRDGQGKACRAAGFDLWWKSPKRREYKGVDFLPGQEAPADIYNLWRGFEVKPKRGDFGLYGQLIEQAVARGNPKIEKYILDWMAHAVQKPWEKPGTALALPGGQGVGKGSIARQFGLLFGPHFLHADSPDVLTGRFNLHLAHKIVLYADEAVFSGDHRIVGILKARITENDLTFEGKGRDIITMPNYWRIIAASNEAWMVPAGTDDRRWAVFRVNDAFKGDREFWRALHAQMDNGGRAALLHHLLERDISSFVPSDYPQTEARSEQIKRSFEPITAWWFERLEAGAPTSSAKAWPEFVPCALVLADLNEFVKRSARHEGVNSTRLGMELTRMCGLASRQRWSAMGNARVYDLPPLDEARARFEQATHFRHDWPQDASETDAPEAWTREPAKVSG